jgi:large conductance mechanosensitive channel
MKRNRSQPQMLRTPSVLNLDLEALPPQIRPSKEVVSLWKQFQRFAIQKNIFDMASGIIVGWFRFMPLCPLLRFLVFIVFFAFFGVVDTERAGGAFGKIVKSLVDDVIMPPIGLLLSGVDFANIFYVLKRGKKNVDGRYRSLAAAKADGAVTINHGAFINNLLNFTVVSVVIFLLLRSVGKMKEGKKRCRYCYKKIHERATRCPQCCSLLFEDDTNDYNSDDSI